MKRKASQSQWLLNRHAFKQSGPRALRGIANFEFNEAINSLKQAGLGKVRTRLKYDLHPMQLQFSLGNNPTT